LLISYLLAVFCYYCFILVIYLLAIMSETTNFSSTMISSLMVETSVPKTMLGLWWSWMDPITCYGRRRSLYSLALKI